MKLEIKKKLLSRSERVKSVELHPSLPWVLIALYAGNVTIFDYNQQTQVRSFEVTSAPVRCAKFIARKQWIVVGADDTKIRVFNYNTSEKLKTIDDHTDFIRYSKRNRILDSKRRNGIQHSKRHAANRDIERCCGDLPQSG